MSVGEPDATRRRVPSRLRVGIDAHALGERKTGNERFIANLIPALRARTDHDLFVYVTTDAGARRVERLGLERTAVQRVRPANRMARVALGLPFRAWRDDLDVLFVQYVAGPIVPCPVVPVVHDVAFWRHPEFFSAAERLWMRRAIPWTMRRSSAIVTVSEFSRDEIARSFGIDPSRIAVALEAADPVFSDPPRVPAGVDPPYVLAVGNLQPRKNLAVLVRAFRELAVERPDVRERLVVVGQPWHRAEELVSDASDLVDAGRMLFTGYLPDERIVALVAGATAFAFPSVYEGFGLPVVEAMAAGSPVVVSDIPVMREVARDAAVYVPPHDASAWARSIADLVDHPDRRAALVLAGRARAGSLSWDATAAAIAPVLEAAARERGSARTRSR